jgi:hypothetical protein
MQVVGGFGAKKAAQEVNKVTLPAFQAASSGVFHDLTTTTTEFAQNARNPSPIARDGWDQLTGHHRMLLVTVRCLEGS